MPGGDKHPQGSLRVPGPPDARQDAIWFGVHGCFVKCQVRVKLNLRAQIVPVFPSNEKKVRGGRSELAPEWPGDRNNSYTWFTISTPFSHIRLLQNPNKSVSPCPRRSPGLSLASSWSLPSAT